MSKKYIILLIIAIILLLFAIIFGVVSFNSSKNSLDNISDDINTQSTFHSEISKTQDIETKFNDITFYDKNKKEYKLSDFKDKAMVLFFFSPDNQDSIEDLNKINEIYGKYKDKVNFIMICSSKTFEDDIQKNSSLEIYYDLYEEGIRKYNITEFPSIIYFKENNEVFQAKSGFTTSDSLDANFELLYNGEYIDLNAIDINAVEVNDVINENIEEIN